MQRFVFVLLSLFCGLVIFVSQALAITINTAEVQNDLAVVSGSKAAKVADIRWEGVVVTKSNKGGSFSFTGVKPSDCVGTLSDGVSSVEVALAYCVVTQEPILYPISLPKTGQTTCAACGYGSPAGDDGYWQKGVSWPNPRFTNNFDGTVTDNLTNLVWTHNPNCSGNNMSWYSALTFCSSLQSGMCGLTDGSGAGDWRLPNRNELLSLIDISRAQPALPSEHPFVNIYEMNYWTSSVCAAGIWTAGWYVKMAHGDATCIGRSYSDQNFYAWCIRDLKK